MKRRSPIMQYGKNPLGERSGGEKNSEQNRTRNLRGAVHVNRSRRQFARSLRQAAVIGALPSSRRALPVENKYRYNCLLDRGTTNSNQSSAESDELLGQAVGDELRRF